MAQAIGTAAALKVKEAGVARRLDRRVLDLMISWTGAMIAVVLLALGAAGTYGGAFALDNVRDRLEPQNIVFPPLDAMSPEEQAELGHYAGATVDTGNEAEAYSRFIGGHLAAVNDGATYSETSAQARALAEDDPARAELNAKVDTLFRGETLRAILLNAYGWWTVGQIALYAGIGLLVAGLILATLVFFGFRHARRSESAA